MIESFTDQRVLPSKLQHLVLFTHNLEGTSQWYQDIFNVQFSAKNHPDSSAAMRLLKQTMHFYSFGYYHHDLAFAYRPDVKPDQSSMLYYSMIVRTSSGLDILKDNLVKNKIPYNKGRVLASALTDQYSSAIHFKDPINNFWIEILQGESITPRHFRISNNNDLKNINSKSNARPSHAAPESMNGVAAMLKRKWFREMLLLPVTLVGKRTRNKTKDYGVLRNSTCILSSIEQMTFFVMDLSQSTNWLEVMGFQLSRICPAEPHPFIQGHSLRCAYFNLKEHLECVILIEHRNDKGQLVAPSIKDVFHCAFELDGAELKDTFSFFKQKQQLGIKHYYGPVKHNDVAPHGDGESGGNVAIYYYMPDFHHIEFFTEMDNVDTSNIKSH